MNRLYSRREIPNTGAWLRIEPITGRLIQVKSYLDYKKFNRFIITIKVLDITVQSKSFVKDFTLEIVRDTINQDEVLSDTIYILTNQLTSKDTKNELPNHNIERNVELPNNKIDNLGMSQDTEFTKNDESTESKIFDFSATHQEDNSTRQIINHSYASGLVIIVVLFTVLLSTVVTVLIYRRRKTKATNEKNHFENKIEMKEVKNPIKVVEKGSGSSVMNSENDNSYSRGVIINQAFNGDCY